MNSSTLITMAIEPGSVSRYYSLVAYLQAACFHSGQVKKIKLKIKFKFNVTVDIDGIFMKQCSGLNQKKKKKRAWSWNRSRLHHCNRVRQGFLKSSGC